MADNDATLEALDRAAAAVADARQLVMSAAEPSGTVPPIADPLGQPPPAADPTVPLPPAMPQPEPVPEAGQRLPVLWPMSYLWEAS